MTEVPFNNSTFLFNSSGKVYIKSHQQNGMAKDLLDREVTFHSTSCLHEAAVGGPVIARGIFMYTMRHGEPLSVVLVLEMSPHTLDMLIELTWEQVMSEEHHAKR